MPKTHIRKRKHRGGTHKRNQPDPFYYASRPLELIRNAGYGTVQGLYDIASSANSGTGGVPSSMLNFRKIPSSAAVSLYHTGKNATKGINQALHLKGYDGWRNYSAEEFFYPTNTKEERNARKAILADITNYEAVLARLLRVKDDYENEHNVELLKQLYNGYHETTEAAERVVEVLNARIQEIKTNKPDEDELVELEKLKQKYETIINNLDIEVEKLRDNSHVYHSIGPNPKTFHYDNELSLHRTSVGSELVDNDKGASVWNNLEETDTQDAANASVWNYLQGTDAQVAENAKAFNNHATIKNKANAAKNNATRKYAASVIQETYKKRATRRENAKIVKELNRIESQTSQYVELTNNYYQRTVKALDNINKLHLDLTQFSKLASKQAKNAETIYGNARSALFAVKRATTGRDKAEQRKIAIHASEEAGEVMVLAEQSLKDAIEYTKLLKRIVEGTQLPNKLPITFEQIKGMIGESINNVKIMTVEIKDARKPKGMNQLFYNKLKALSEQILIYKKYIHLKIYALSDLKPIVPLVTKTVLSEKKIKQIEESNQLTEEAMTTLPQILLLTQYHIYVLNSLISLIYQIQNKKPCTQLGIKQVNGFPEDDIKALACIWANE